MKKALFKNLVSAILFLVVLLAADFLLVKFEIGQIPKCGDVFWCVFLVVYFATSLVANKALFKNIKNIYLRLSAIVFFSCLITSVFGFTVLISLVNFHLAIGGRI